jgi:addiction module HigA family antidote
METASPHSFLLERASSRRAPATHPGPELQRDYLDPLRLETPALAAQIGMDPERLGRMLGGFEPIDVETAIRLARSLQINPRTLMERQISYDFAVLRNDPGLCSIAVLADEGRVPFPDFGFLRGELSGLRENWGWGEVRPETLAFFSDGHEDEHPSARMHEIRKGSRLRVYGPAGEIVWVGVVLDSLEGKPLLPYVRPAVWIEWFLNHWRADFFPAI